jgi:hypothetical protein
MARLVLGDATLRVGLPALSASCPNFNETLPCQVPSSVSVEAFQMFVPTLEGMAPALTTENRQDPLSLCNEFGFPGLLSQVMNFILGHSVVDYEARQRVNGVE